jgi:FtsP/CotA-like multicopper oxidase with cupredoxin domain
VIDVDSEASGSVGEGLPPGSRLLGMVRVAPGTPVRGDIGTWLTNQLVAAAERTMPDEVKPTVIADLKGGLKLSRFVAHPDVGPGEVTGTQDLTFLIDVTNPKAGVQFEVGSQDYPPRPYDPGRLDRKLTLGGVDEWTLQSHFVSHPFHIHVNPFQIISILDPDGRDVSRSDIVDDYALRASPKGKIDPQYRGLKGVWKDTLWIKSLIGEVKSLPAGTSGIYKVTIRTRYQRYIGEYVLHCHILDHEDQGMMQNVAVVLPGGAPASVNAQEAQPGSH